MRTSPQEFSVGILVFRQYDLALRCLRSVLSQTIKPFKIYIADNGGLLGKQSDCTVITPPNNIGCAAGWNLLMDAIHPRPAIILNDDLVLLPDSCERLMEPESPAIVLGHGFSCFRIDEPIVRTIGTFDEGYWPVYYEDCDYKVRLKQAGLSLIDLGNIVQSHGNHDQKARPYQDLDKWEKEEFDKLFEKNKQRFISKWGGLPSDVGV